jgi:isopenicillin N synthase-like dioxygenase
MNLNTGTAADEVSQTRTQSNRFAQLDDEEKENIVMETESATTKETNQIWRQNVHDPLVNSVDIPSSAKKVISCKTR